MEYYTGILSCHLGDLFLLYNYSSLKRHPNISGSHYFFKSCISKYILVLAILIQSNFVSAKTVVSVEIPRTIVALYDSRSNEQIFNTKIHQLAEMPLNHLGLKVRYHDIHDALPATGSLLDTRGILLWLPSSGVPNPNQLLHWLIKQAEEGRKIVVMGSHGFEKNEKGEFADKNLIEKFWKTLGLRKTARWSSVTYDLTLHAEDENMVAYEKPFLGMLPPFPELQIINLSMVSYASVIDTSKNKTVSEVITIGRKGSYVAPGYANITINAGKKRYWFLNPYAFYRQAFDVSDLPIPDTTTQTGRRIYYSHIDGDGWRNHTKVPKYKDNQTLSAEVILKEIILKYSNLPVTVAPIAGDLDDQWFGTNRAAKLAREIFKLPHVEAGSHTYSHPYHWDFFRDENVESEAAFEEFYKTSKTKMNKAISFLNLNPSKSAIGTSPVVDSSSFARNTMKHPSIVDKVQETYGTPRAYYNGSYDLTHDIAGSVKFIQTLLPTGKRIQLLQWSGNALPFPDAIRESRILGIRNLNGGDTRFDSEFDSISWVMPIGRNVGGEQQIYASASNENTYTNFWTKRFYGFQFLIETLMRTETPIRLKPINIYYHMYSGERLASLNALRKVLNYAMSRSITPITASQFASIADGFYTTEIEKIGDNRWRIAGRGELQTIRFDHAPFKGVDFFKSEGVIGQTHSHGSLYVALDPDYPEPIIATKSLVSSSHEPKAERPYLISSRWEVKKLEILSEGFKFKVRGFGHGNMTWFVPNNGSYEIKVEYVDGSKHILTSKVKENNQLLIPLHKITKQYSTVSVQRGAT